MASRVTCKDLTNTSHGGGPGVKTPSADRSRTSAPADKSFGVRGASSKTPGSSSKQQRSGKTPSKATNALTPSRNTALTASGKKTGAGGDRYIPNRSTSDFDLAHYLHTSLNSSQSSQLHRTADDSSLLLADPQQQEYARKMSEALNGGVTAPVAGASANGNGSNDEVAAALHREFRILSFQQKPPAAPAGHANSHKVLYSARATPASSCKKLSRHIPTMPERILDAPAIGDDFYLNILDWNSGNLMAVALSSHLYIWNSATGDIELLMELEDQPSAGAVGSEEYISGVAWIKEGPPILAVGMSNGSVLLWDVEAKRKLRTMTGHSERVGSLAWNEYILSSGSRDGQIRHSDVRVAEHHVGTLNGHTQEVCGLKWAPNGRYLASGGNDNLVNLWPRAGETSLTTADAPIYTLSEHQAAVKALAWCPWQPNILATGGGTADRHIRLWNVNSGTCLHATDTQSQVCSLLWSAEYKELISAHGYPNYELAIWKYPDMKKTAELKGHTARILQMAASPDGEMVVSASSDESLRIWNCFAVDPATKKNRQKKASAVQTQSNKPTRGVLPKTLR